MFSQEYMPYIRGVANLHLNGAGVDEKSRLVAIAVAIAVTQALPIPTGSIGREEVHSVFEQQHRMSVTSVLSRYNEAAVLDLPYALEMARKFWLLRVQAATRVLPSMVIEGQDFLKAYLNVTTIFSSSDDELMTRHGRELFVLLSACMEVEASRLNPSKTV
jgi:hypothetical protein